MIHLLSWSMLLVSHSVQLRTVVAIVTTSQAQCHYIHQTTALCSIALTICFKLYLDWFTVLNPNQHFPCKKGRTLSWTRLASVHLACVCDIRLTTHFLPERMYKTISTWKYMGSRSGGPTGGGERGRWEVERGRRRKMSGRRGKQKESEVGGRVTQNH